MRAAAGAPAPPPALIPFVYSYVELSRGSGAAGFILALASLAPVAVLVSLCTLLASRRDLATAALLAGQIVNEALNHALKYAARVPRPTPSLHPAFDEQSPYAWPSDHAQFAAFTAAYICRWAPRRWAVGARAHAATRAAALAAAALVCASRVALGYHTRAQVAAGAAVGAAAGALWFEFVEAALRPRFAALAATPLARALLIRDATHVRDVLAVEYAATLAARAGKAADAPAGARDDAV